MKTLSIIVAASALAGAVTLGSSAFADQARRQVTCEPQAQGQSSVVACTPQQQVKNTGDRRDEEQEHGRTVDAVGPSH